MAQAGRALPPRLVAVSKGQPVELMHEAYTYGARHFGENYVSPSHDTLYSTHYLCCSLFLAGSRVM